MRISHLCLIFILLYGISGANGWWPFGNDDTEDGAGSDVQNVVEEGSGTFMIMDI